jgi:hypothetical protein
MMRTEEEIYISDCQGKLQTEIEGYFQRLQNDDGRKVACFVTPIADATTIGELINLCGYTFDSVIGKRVIIYIEEP